MTTDAFSDLYISFGFFPAYGDSVFLLCRKEQDRFTSMACFGIFCILFLVQLELFADSWWFVADELGLCSVAVPEAIQGDFDCRDHLQCSVARVLQIL